ncbi:hypothetical protein BD410DRAFT_730406 [Rickenella mellea]|uniref:Uncharacterized protein n=1 Tax=Rickenella mellea TaxID=50990 RepID=A0A4Y7PQ78_9AGAM|nr:hypothetical protein BD410DRAFT_730406 [Rickenella mellea]
MCAEDKPTNTTFLAARRLKNGGVVYDMSTPKAAAWLKSKDVMKAFLESFGGTSIIKERAYTVIAEFVPVTLDLNDADTCAQIEKDNNLPSLSILSTKWIKPVYKRSQTQRTAHLIIALNHPNQQINSYGTAHT